PCTCLPFHRGFWPGAVRSQRKTAFSEPPIVASRVPSGETATASRPLWCLNARVCLPVLTSQTRANVSQPPETTASPLGVNVTHVAGAVCPSKVRLLVPPYASQTQTRLSATAATRLPSPEKATARSSPTSLPDHWSRAWTSHIRTVPSRAE